MYIEAVTSKIISTLGNKESLVPIMLKDGVDSASLTYKSFKEGGIIEGKDRAVDEFGTQAIWIGGIPMFKKLADKTIYKLAKINPDVDTRIIMNKEYSKWAKENAKGIMPNTKSQSVKSALEDCLKDGGKKVKNLYVTKITAATALTLGTYFLLTKLKQKNTKNSVLKKMNEQINTAYDCLDNNKPKIFTELDNKNKSVSFKGLLKNVSNAILYNPVHNMKIIDAGITTERLACSRNKTELAEHAIKEGGFLFFLYGFGNIIEKGINKFSSKVLKRPIELPIEVLTDENLSKALESGIISNEAEKINNCTTLTQKLNFIKENGDNILVKAAKKAKIIATTKNKSAEECIDTSKYIDMKEIENLKKNLKNINEQYKNSKVNVNRFINQTKALKVGSVLANIGLSCLFLGYLLPKAVYKYREIKTGTTKFHVEENIKKEKKK